MDNWSQTYSGIKFDFFNPSPEMININDIARGLSHECRYAGQCEDFYSVAEHACLVSLLVPEHMALAGLMHDAAEAYIRDIPSPLKRLLPDFKKIEKKVHRAIMLRFNIWYTMEEFSIVKYYDLALIREEIKRVLPGPYVDQWDKDLPKIDKKVAVQCWDPVTAREKFLERFHMLTGESERRAA